MQKTILIGGEAGQGVAKTSYLVGKVFTQAGYYVFNYKDYPSLIKGGHNFNVLKISSKPVYSHEIRYDIVLALDQKTIDKHEKDLTKDGFILGGKRLRAKNFIGIDVQSILKKLKAPSVIGNNVLTGYLFKLLGLSLDTSIKTIEKEFSGSDKNKANIIKRAVKEGYNIPGEKKESLKTKNKKKYFLTGNEAVASGAIASGLDVYIAYPMTPATSVLHYLALRQLKDNILVLQLENEISVINAALGASFTGAISMVGTSGGGFALMSEATSLQGMSEIPLVVYLAQRTAPSTGVPTYTTQGDLKFAVNIGHGEFPKIVVAPGDAKESISRTEEAFYLSQKYRVLSIIMSDKHLGESHYSFDELDKSQLQPSRNILKNPSTLYKNYKLTKTGVSPRIVPGQGPFARATSYEHDENGYTIEDTDMTKKMNDKRFRKLKYIKEEIEKLNPVNIYGKGDNLIISWGSTKGAILDALYELKNFRFMQISYIKPFPQNQVKKEIEKSKNIILIENNVSGLLGQIITEQTGYFIKNKILKYDAMPFTPSGIVNRIKKITR